MQAKELQRSSKSRLYGRRHLCKTCVLCACASPRLAWRRDWLWSFYQVFLFVFGWLLRMSALATSVSGRRWRTWLRSALRLLTHRRAALRRRKWQNCLRWGLLVHRPSSARRCQRCRCRCQTCVCQGLLSFSGWSRASTAGLSWLRFLCGCCGSRSEWVVGPCWRCWWFLWAPWSWTFLWAGRRRPDCRDTSPDFCWEASTSGCQCWDDAGAWFWAFLRSFWACGLHSAVYLDFMRLSLSLRYLSGLLPMAS